MRKKLSKKQSAVLDELFSCEQTFSEKQVLEKHGVTEAHYRRWQNDEVFTSEFEARIESFSRQSRLLVARYATFAAAKLIVLTESANPETARKACLDIIDRIQNLVRHPRGGTEDRMRRIRRCKKSRPAPPTQFLLPSHKKSLNSSLNKIRSRPMENRVAFDAQSHNICRLQLR
jgi:hypothetical protein